VEAAKYPWVKSAEMLSNLWDVIRRKAPANATGPVGITKMIKRSIELGWVEALEFLAFLNVALGLFNLLPIPALDGGRLVFLGYELVTRRRPNPRIEAAVHMVGFVVLALLIVVITFRDIRGG
jgi:regulator of sigma E protease